MLCNTVCMYPPLHLSFRAHIVTHSPSDPSTLSHLSSNKTTHLYTLRSHICVKIWFCIDTQYWNVVLGHLWCSLYRVCQAFSWSMASISEAKSWSVFSTAVSKIQASKHYVGSLPLVLKDRRCCFSQGERFTVQLPLNRMLALRN